MVQINIKAFTPMADRLETRGSFQPLQEDEDELFYFTKVRIYVKAVVTFIVLDITFTIINIL